MCAWADLPEILLEDIYCMLPFSGRYYCSRVCYNWYETFYSPRVWRNLVINETLFTHRKYSLFGGYELTVNHDRVKLYLARVGQHVRNIRVLPTLEFHNLYELLLVLATFLEFFKSYPMPCLTRFEFTFACESRIPVVGPVVLGTGGKMLDIIKRNMARFKNLEHIVMNNLLLENQDAPGILEKLVCNCGNSLVYLEVLNFTKDKCSLFHLGMLRNIRKLVITPPQLPDDVMIMLADSTLLEELVLVQDRYTTEADAISASTWSSVKLIAPDLRVTLQVNGRTHSEMLIQEKAPVWHIVYSTPYAKVSHSVTYRMAEHYKDYLVEYGHLTLPRHHGSRSFHSRADASLVYLIRRCTHLKTLYIRERVSTATLLIVALEGKSLEHLYVRRNAVLLKCDWPNPPKWDRKQCMWMKYNARSYEAVEREISHLLGKKWHMLSDKEYMKLNGAF